MTDAQIQAAKDAIGNAATCEEKLALASALIDNLITALKDCQKTRIPKERAVNQETK